jgi:FAD/FMN-containing dehydrogenase/NAD-dependent dihydropyrimidine dehydrogenase PreA subunit
MSGVTELSEKTIPVARTPHHCYWRMKRIMMKTEELRKILSNMTILDTPVERETYSHDIGDIPPVLTRLMFKIQPDFVVQPKTIEDIVKVIKLANENKVPVIPRGAASWGFGGVIPTSGGVVIDLSPFRKIMGIDTVTKTITVESGARWNDIDIIARKKGLCLMTYPSSKFSTLGGWISTGGYAINSFKYGHISRQIASMKVVTGTGEVKQLSPSGKEFEYYLGTEGQFGIVVEVVLKLRDIPQGSYSHLLYFPSNKDAFTFIDNWAKNPTNEKYKPNTMRFLDERHLGDINTLMKTGIFKKSAAVLMEFGSQEDDKNFKKYLAGINGVEEAPYYASNYIWNERLFGMKIKRLGPTILASEVIIPITAAASFIDKARKLGSYFGVEIVIDCYILDAEKALIMCNYLCDSRKMKYYINVPLVSVLTRAAVGRGAEPYGLGLWNAGFLNHLYKKDKQRELKAYKAKVDPNNILNPGKPFSLGSKGISGIVFNPGVFGTLIQLLTFTAPVLGKVIVLLLGKNKKMDSLDIELSTHACAKCGNCMAVCPAYLVTGNEMDTAKGKIAIARKLQAGQTITKEEAAAAFQCMHCKACEEICQTNLELMTLWDVLEKELETKFGRPDAQVADFLKKVNDSKEYWDMVERYN